MDGKGRPVAVSWKKWEDWRRPGRLCLLLFHWTGLAWDYHFDLNDDVLIRDILSGVYTGGPEALTAQLLWPLAALLSGLYRLLPGVPVFGLFLWLCQAGSVFQILRRSVRSFDGPVKLLAGAAETLLFAACLTYHLVFVQYTVTAGLLAAAAVVSFLTLEEREEEGAAAFWLRGLPAALLFWLALCLRSEMALLLLPLAGVGGIWKWAGRRPALTGKNAASFLGLFGLILGGVLLCFGADRLACSDPEWREFEGLFDARTEIYDFYDASLRSWEENREFYESLGLTETQCALLSNYNYGADDAIDAQVLERIAAHGKETRGTFAHSFSEGLWLYAQRLKNNRAIVPDDQLPWLLLEGGLGALLLALAFAGWMRRRTQNGGRKAGVPETDDRKTGNRNMGVRRTADTCGIRGTGVFWKLLLFGAVRSGLWLYLILRERVPERISHPLYLCELLLLAWLLLDTWRACFPKTPSEETLLEENMSFMGKAPFSEKAARAAEIMVSLLFLVMGLLLLPQEVRRTGQEYARRQQVNQVNLAALSRYEEEPELLYLADVMSTVEFSEKLFTEKSRPGNYDLLGGWLCKSPHSQKKLAAFGYETMGQAVLTGENVRFVGEPGADFSWLSALLAEHGVSGKLVQEEEISAGGRSLFIWRLDRGE